MSQVVRASRSLLPPSSTQASSGCLDLGYEAGASIGVAVTAAEAGGAAEGYFKCNSSPELPPAWTQQWESLDVRVAMSPLDDRDQIS